MFAPLHPLRKRGSLFTAGRGALANAAARGLRSWHESLIAPRCPSAHSAALHHPRAAAVRASAGMRARSVRLRRMRARCCAGKWRWKLRKREQLSKQCTLMRGKPPPQTAATPGTSRLESLASSPCAARVDRAPGHCRVWHWAGARPHSPMAPAPLCAIVYNP